MTSQQRTLIEQGWQDGIDVDTLAHIHKLSRAEVQAIYDRLDAEFDAWMTEIDEQEAK